MQLTPLWADNGENRVNRQLANETFSDCLRRSRRRRTTDRLRWERPGVDDNNSLDPGEASRKACNEIETRPPGRWVTPAEVRHQPRSQNQ